MKEFLSFSADRLTPELKAIRKAVGKIDLVCPGTLLKRWKKCGQPNCRCKRDPKAIHGPYYEWSRYRDGRLVHNILTAGQAALVERAIANHQQILKHLAQWSLESERIIGVIIKDKKRD